MIAVLGASGFIGRALVRRLAVEETALRVLGRTPPATAPPGVAFRRADLADPATLAPALEGCTVLVHLASTSVPGTAGADPAADAQANVVGGLRLVEAAKAAGVRRILFPSSGGAVYGAAAATPTPEDQPLRPMGAYGAAKASLEAYLCAAASAPDGPAVTVLRLSNLYGPGQSPFGGQGAVAAFGHRLLRGEPVELWGDGAVVRDHLFIEDAVDALLLALSWTDAGFGVWNVGSGRGVSTLELLAALERAAGVRAQVRRGPARGYDVPVSVLDCARIAARGWRAATPLEQGLPLALAALRPA